MCANLGPPSPPGDAPRRVKTLNPSITMEDPCAREGAVGGDPPARVVYAILNSVAVSVSVVTPVSVVIPVLSSTVHGRDIQQHRSDNQSKKCDSFHQKSP